MTTHMHHLFGGEAPKTDMVATTWRENLGNSALAAGVWYSPFGQMTKNHTDEIGAKH